MRRKLNLPIPVLDRNNRVLWCWEIYNCYFDAGAQNYNSQYSLIQLPETPARINNRVGIVLPVSNWQRTTPPQHYQQAFPDMKMIGSRHMMKAAHGRQMMYTASPDHYEQ